MAGVQFSRAFLNNQLQIKDTFRRMCIKMIAGSLAFADIVCEKITM